jgi:hypothetical protein
MHQKPQLWVESCGFQIYRLFPVSLDGSGEIIVYCDGDRIFLETFAGQNIGCAYASCRVEVSNETDIATSNQIQFSGRLWPQMGSLPKDRVLKEIIALLFVEANSHSDFPHLSYTKNAFSTCLDTLLDHEGAKLCPSELFIFFLLISLFYLFTIDINAHFIFKLAVFIFFTYCFIVMENSQFLLKIVVNIVSSRETM